MTTVNHDIDQKIVDKDDACFPGVGEVLPIQANHLQICKFDDAQDDGYKNVRAKVKQMMEATGIVEPSRVSTCSIYQS